MSKRFLCRIGLHKFDRLEVHTRGVPEYARTVSLIERCECGDGRLLRYEVPTSFHVWKYHDKQKGHHNG